jgi:hypothetical protein
MIKRSNLLGIVLVFVFLAGFVCAEYDPNDDPVDLGSGWYGISTCSQLQNINTFGLDKKYKLLNNIDCLDTVNWNGGFGFEPIGNCGSYNKCVNWGQHNKFFSGTFYGNGFVISDLFIN